MTYLNWSVLDKIDAPSFHTTKPYPWLNPEGVLTEEGRKALQAEFPEMKLFRASFGMARQFGQKPHDHYELFYDSTVPVPAPWKDFIAELDSDRYRTFVGRLFGKKNFRIRYQWIFAVRGCSTSPHTDGPRKIGSHLFYLNDPDEWDPAWQGATNVLDDEGKKTWQSAPGFDDFARETPSIAVGNRCFLFLRTDHSWHSVRELTCPEGKMRRIFSVVIEHPPTLRERVKAFLLRLRGKNA